MITYLDAAIEFDVKEHDVVDISISEKFALNQLLLKYSISKDSEDGGRKFLKHRSSYASAFIR
jgi:hypothetical protein